MHAASPPRILLVEDSPLDAELLELELREAGLHADILRIDQLSRVREALAGFRPDVVISDWRLPGFSGLEVLHLVREHAPGVPFVLLCGVYEEDSNTRQAVTGANLVLRKDAMEEAAPALRALLAPDPDAVVADDASSDA